MFSNLRFEDTDDSISRSKEHTGRLYYELFIEIPKRCLGYFLPTPYRMQEAE